MPVKSQQGLVLRGLVEEDDDKEADDVSGEDEHDDEDKPAFVVQDVSQESGKDHHLLILSDL